jgi:hypothetical protein
MKKIQLFSNHKFKNGKFGFNLDVAALEDYINQVATRELIVKSYFNDDILRLMRTVDGNVSNKFKQSINLLDTDATFQNDSCGFDPSGLTPFTQREITVGSIKVQEALCIKDLEKLYTGAFLPRGANYVDPSALWFAETYLALKAAIIQQQVSRAIWLGDTTLGDVNLNKFDGLNKIINAAIADGVIQATPAGNITTSNVRTIIEAMYILIPQAIQDEQDLYLLMGNDALKTLRLKLGQDNLFNTTPDDVLGNVVVYPYTNLKCIGIKGLSGTNKMHIARFSNLYYGTDLLSDIDTLDFFYAREAMEFRYTSAFKLGTQIAKPEEIVTYKPS